MNNDYLWDRSGNDPETEALERSLGAFRSAGGKAPRLPVRTAASPKRRFPMLFRTGLAFAAAVVVVLVLFSGFPQVGLERGQVNIDFDSSTPVERNSDIPSTAPAKNELKEMPASGNRRSRLSRKSSVARRTARRKVLRYRKPDVTAPSTAGSTASFASLTEEERYAYGRLMLALSITSSQLKIVRDKVDGIVETDADSGTRR